MPERLPPLNALRAFEVAGRCSSLSAAACELGVSVASISRHIATLEAHFNATLFTRHRAGVTLSEAGRQFHSEISGAFDTLSAASRAMRRETESVQVRCYSTLATEWLLPRVPDFRARHPEVDLQIELTLPETDRPVGPHDLVITTTPPNEAYFRSEAIFTLAMTPVCAPHAARNWLSGDFTLLFSQRERIFWDKTLPQMEMPPIGRVRRVRFDTLSLTYQAARGGGGVALGILFFVMEDLRSGRLVAPFDHAFRFPVTHYCTYHRSMLRHTGSTVFRRWLREQAQTTRHDIDAFFNARGPEYVVDLVLKAGTEEDHHRTTY